MDSSNALVMRSYFLAGELLRPQAAPKRYIGHREKGHLSMKRKVTNPGFKILSNVARRHSPIGLFPAGMRNLLEVSSPIGVDAKFFQTQHKSGQRYRVVHFSRSTALDVSVFHDEFLLCRRDLSASICFSPHQ